MAAVAVALAASVIAVYGQTGAFDFVHLDDPQYVSENPKVSAGLTWAGVAWAFTTGHAANWHPVTWLSHMTDVTLFGLDAGRHHLVSVGLHLANTLLLFWLLVRLTGARAASAFVAAIFAVHPTHVESVAWIAERKDVLSGFFWLLTTTAYVRHVERPTRERGLVVIAVYAAGLMAKPMLVTLPFVLLLLDWWPLGRRAALSWPALAREKIPLFALAAISSVVTLVVQQSGGAVSTLTQVPFGERLTNAMFSYGAYIGKCVWPVDLAVVYTRPEWASAGVAWLVAIGLAAMTWLALRSARAHPYFVVGWLWYLGTLVPVIGLVQVGVQSMADRYLYLPSIGLTIVLAWTADSLARRSRTWAYGLAVAALALTMGAGVVAHRQVQTWRNNVTLFTHASVVTLRQTPAQAHRSLGNALYTEKRFDEAIAHFEALVRLEPRSDAAHLVLGLAYEARGRTADARRALSEALRLNPSSAIARQALDRLR